MGIDKLANSKHRVNRGSKVNYGIRSRGRWMNFSRRTFEADLSRPDQLPAGDPCIEV